MTETFLKFPLFYLANEEIQQKTRQEKSSLSAGLLSKYLNNCLTVLLKLIESSDPVQFGMWLIYFSSTVGTFLCCFNSCSTTAFMLLVIFRHFSEVSEVLVVLISLKFFTLIDSSWLTLVTLLSNVPRSSWMEPAFSGPENFKKSTAKKNSWNQINQFHEKHFLNIFHKN